MYEFFRCAHPFFSINWYIELSTYQVSVKFFADDWADFHNAHEDEKTSEKYRKTWKHRKYELNYQQTIHKLPNSLLNTIEVILLLSVMFLWFHCTFTVISCRFLQSMMISVFNFHTFLLNFCYFSFLNDSPGPKRKILFHVWLN